MSNPAAAYTTGSGAPAEPLITLAGLTKAYRTPAGDFWALRGIDLTIAPVEFVALSGRSGAGKSTLINMITGIDRPSGGSVFVAGQPVHAMNEAQITRWRGRQVGVVFQSFQLMPMLTCLQNVMLPMDFAGLYRNPKERTARALQLLDEMGIAEHAQKLPSAVSGGQRQRVAIARALANDPIFIAADEPTGSLDSRTADAVFAVFQRLVDQGKTIFMATHDRELASRVSRVVRIEDGQIAEDIEQHAAAHHADHYTEPAAEPYTHHGHDALSEPAHEAVHERGQQP